MDDKKDSDSTHDKDGWKTWLTCCFGMLVLERKKGVASPASHSENDSLHNQEGYPSLSQQDEKQMRKLARAYFTAHPSLDREDSIYATPTAEQPSPWSQARSNRMSSLMEDSPPGVNTSGITEESNFSALATGRKRSQQMMESPSVRPLAERSLAALTSGVADVGRGCR